MTLSFVLPIAFNPMRMANTMPTERRLSSVTAISSSISVTPASRLI
jgi:hypothetical protein